MNTLVKTIKDNLATFRAVNVLCFAFGWGLLWEEGPDNIYVTILSNTMFVAFVIASFLFKNKLKKEGRPLPRLKRNNWLIFGSSLWITGVILQALGNEQVVAITAQAAEIILICGLTILAINKNAEKYIW